MLNVNRGLSQNMVNALAQDSLGFIWIGTNDGLNRYDGRNLKVFRNNLRSDSTLSDNYITSLLVDSRKRLWVGTKNGLNLYQERRETFLRILSAGSKTESMAVPEIRSICEGRDGDIWAISRDGALFRIRDDGKLWNEFKINPAMLSPDYIREIVFVRDSQFLVSSYAGLYLLTVNPGNLTYSVLLISKGSFTSIYHDGDNYWVGGEGFVLRVSGSQPTTQVRVYNLFGSDIEFRNWTFGVHDITGLTDSKLFITNNIGLLELDKNSGLSRTIRLEKQYPDNLFGGFPTSLLMDKSGIIWAGTAGYGALSFSLKESRFHYLSCTDGTEPFFSIQTIREDKRKNIWFQDFASSIYRINTKTGISEKIFHNRESEFSYSDFYPLEWDRVWLLNHNSVVLYDRGSNKVVRQMTTAAAKGIGDLQQLVSVTDDQIIAAASMSLVFFSMDSDTPSVVPFPPRFNGKVHAVLYTSSEIWLSVDDNLLCYNTSRRTWKSFSPFQYGFSNPRIRAIAEGRGKDSGSLWLGTDGGGLIRFTPGSGEVKIFTSEDGLPNDVVYQIQRDDSGSLWMSTNNGLAKFDPSTGSFRSFNYFDGLQDNEFNTRSSLKTLDGHLYFGGIKGITWFRPGSVKSASLPPTLVMTGFSIFNKAVNILDESSPVSVAVPYLREITLSHSQNSFSFEFAALDFSAPQNNRYRYKLEGFDEDWIDNGTSGIAFYTNVPPGEYVFRVAGSNSDEVWNQSGLSIAIVVSPPFWRAWWAYLIYFFATAYTVFLLYRYAERRNRERLEIAASELEKQKLGEISSMKSRFLANITHEFRTPLSLIIGPAEDLADDLQDANQKRILHTLVGNAKKLLGLVNQLLDLSRLEADKMPVKPVRTDIVKYVRGLLEQLRPMAESNNLTLIFTANPPEILAMVDRDIIEKICNNLVTNALKFSLPGSTVSVNVATAASAGHIQLSVTDEGVGISDTEVQNIFKEFYQAEGNVPGRQGFGIGLALVKELTELIGGTVSVESKLNYGTRFLLNFPLVQPEPDTTVPESEDGNGIPGGEEEITSGRKLVLIIEDDPEILQYVVDRFSSHFTVISSSVGTEVSALVSSRMPDLVVSDIMLPGMSGTDICKSIKQNPLTAHIPVVLLTAKADEASILEGLGTGADDYITKPFSSRELLARAQSILRNRELIAERFRNAFFSGDNAPSAGEGGSRTGADEKPGPVMVDEFLGKAYEIIENNISNYDFTVEELAAGLFVSQSQLYRKIKGLTGLTSVKLIQNYRLKKGAEMLKNSILSVSEVCYQVGFNDPSYFIKCFRQEFNLTPQEYRESLK